MTIFLSILLILNSVFIALVAFSTFKYMKVLSDNTNSAIDAFDIRISSNESDINAMKRHQESDDACHGILSLRMNELEKKINEPKKEVLHV